ncbi:phage tail assembly chaperone [Hyphococcus flavus]|uniref:Phage tail assembly chaperone n=1 Tax=Hyphococcus flavus TaxID=1866326 RepID=A0AAE9ZJD4_9PROT|nr:phage tail assembly chaperone [Hyphococcus flavus]WDI32151.1 phage tail assembly chaperone [Hyphococcus flavus]
MFSFAVLRLGLTPENFWRLGVAEWSTLIAAIAPQGGMTRADLNALINKVSENKHA